MTISAVWVRTLETGAEELIFCSDSRLSNGKRFDHCQKVFRFTRTDAAIGFAGDTDWAYPMIVAAVTAADLHLPSQTRALTLSKFKVHLINILNQMQRVIAAELGVPLRSWATVGLPQRTAKWWLSIQ